MNVVVNIVVNKDLFGCCVFFCIFCGFCGMLEVRVRVRVSEREEAGLGLGLVNVMKNRICENCVTQ